MSDVAFSVFTKSWKTVPLGRLGELVRGMGFEGVELPVRPGFQVVPEHAGRDLPAAARQLADAGVTIHSVATAADEAAIMACADAGVPLIRIMAPIGADESYADAEERYRREFDALLPALDRAGVTVGVQNHAGRQVANAVGLRSLIGRYDPRHVAAVWDAGHEAVAGTEPELAIDTIWSHLRRVNLKNAVWLQTAEAAPRAPSGRRTGRPAASGSARGHAWRPSCGGGATPAPYASPPSTAGGYRSSGRPPRTWRSRGRSSRSRGGRALTLRAAVPMLGRGA